VRVLTGLDGTHGARILCVLGAVVMVMVIVMVIVVESLF
jgi:hypothetical protein